MKEEKNQKHWWGAERAGGKNSYERNEVKKTLGKNNKSLAGEERVEGREEWKQTEVKTGRKRRARTKAE